MPIAQSDSSADIGDWVKSKPHPERVSRNLEYLKRCRKEICIKANNLRWRKGAIQYQ